MSRSVYCIGIDVGGTNTDAVIMEYPSKRIQNYVKVPTTKDFQSGISDAIQKVLLTQGEITEAHITGVMIGTTAFVNAIVQRSRDLSPVSVVRLCGTAARSFDPFSSFPESLRTALRQDVFFANGGYELNRLPITPISEPECHQIALQILHKAKTSKTHAAIVISGIFSPICADQEETVFKIFETVFKSEGFVDYSITMSHKVAKLGLLEREGAAILNASVRPLAKHYLSHLQRSIQDLNLLNVANNIFLTSNDGTLVSFEQASEYPIITFNSGPTNSLRGASELCGLKDALVVDIGGTTTDIAFLQGGFPRLASSYVEVGGVRTNFTMPDTLSIGLGGGSLVEFVEGKCVIGPQSVGYKLKKEALSFGGSVMTTTDYALKCGNISIEGADPSRVPLTPERQDLILKEIINKIEILVDKMKTTPSPLPLILVGGGSILVPSDAKIDGISEIHRPHHFDVANAVGAAISQVSAKVEHVADFKVSNRDEEIQKLKISAKNLAIERGAIPDSVEVSVDTVHLTYIPGEVVQITCKAIGNLDLIKISKEHVPFDSPSKIRDIVLKDVVVDPFIKNVGNPEETNQHSGGPKIVYNPQTSRKEWILSEEDIEYMSIGAAILGSGGGGSPYLGKLMAQKVLREGKTIKVISHTTLNEGEYTMPFAAAGAPFVLLERLMTDCAVTDTIERSLSHYQSEGKKISSFMSIEIGGFNSLIPLFASALFDLPVVDGDFMGRAFPEYQMTTNAIYGKPATPLCIGNDKNIQYLVTEVENDDPKKVEEVMRQRVVEFGFMACLGCPAMSKKDIEDVAVKNSLSRAWKLGRAIAIEHKNKRNCADVVAELENGKLLFVGKVIDIHRLTRDGFNFGFIKIDGIDTFKGQRTDIEFQNEYLIAYQYPENSPESKKCVAVVPDLLCLLDTENNQPILAEDLKYGIRVSVVVLPAPSILKTEKSLKVVGPKNFKYEMDYFSFGKEFVQTTSIVDDY